jgi:hypothetical protein
MEELGDQCKVIFA